MKGTWCGDDGPLVLLRQREAGRWRGICFVNDDGEEDVDEDPLTSGRSDYSRVCLALGEAAQAAVVKFEGGEVLALETTGHQARLVSSPKGLIVAKWVCAPDEAAANRALVKLPRLEWKKTGVRWRLSARGVVGLLAAAAAGEEGLAATAMLEKGDYVVETATYAPAEDTGFVLWRLRRNG